MSERIQWNKEQVSADLQGLEDSIVAYRGEDRISYKLSEGMKVADSFLELQEKVQEMFDLLSQTLQNDIGNFRDIMNGMLETDRQIANDL